MRTRTKAAVAVTLALGTLVTTAIVATAGSKGVNATRSSGVNAIEPGAPDGGSTGVGSTEPGSPGGGSSDNPVAVDPIDPGPCGVTVTSGSGPDGTVSFTPCPGDDSPVPDPVPVSLEPTPGMDNVHTIGWDKATLGDDGTAVTLTFYTGVAPCSVLDHVDVSYGTDAVTITLYQGSDPSAKDVACIDIAMLASTTVKLDQPLGDRKIIDGAQA
jgi:hypothetical protein